MRYINKVIERIEKGKTMILEFTIDEFSVYGMQAIPNGIFRANGCWGVSITMINKLENMEVITLQEYMSSTRDC